MTQPPPTAVAPPPKGKRRKGKMILGIILLVVGLGGGVATAAKGMSNYKESVKSLARAPVGCTTTLVFDKPATFTIYAETKGKLGTLGGDCQANGSSYNHPGDKLPKVSMTLVDSSGDEVTLDRGVSASYDVDGYKGTGIRTMKIDQAGTYRLDVESDDTDFAVAIGKNPKEDSDRLLVIGGGVALGGLIFGLLFLLLGLRRRRPDAAMATTDIRNPAGPLPGWPPGTYPGLPSIAPPSPPPPGGYQPVPGPVSPTIHLPGQPPIRLPDQPPGTGFAPPTFAPPAPPTTTPQPTGPPPVTSPPSTGPQPVTPPPPPSGPGWVVPGDDDDADD